MVMTKKIFLLYLMKHLEYNKTNINKIKFLKRKEKYNMNNITITSSRISSNGFDKETCKISLDDLNRLTHLALSLKYTEEDKDISLSGTYFNALERFFRENNENDSIKELKEIYNNIKDDMIVKSLCIQNIELMIIKSNIENGESYYNYLDALEEFVKSVRSNEYQKMESEFDEFMPKIK